MEKLDIAVIDYGMGNLRSVDKALEEFVDQVDIELADHRPREWHVEFESGTP